MRDARGERWATGGGVPLSAEEEGRVRRVRMLGVVREFWVRRIEEGERGERAVMECLCVRASGLGWT